MEERDEIFRIKSTLAQLKSTGELARYNSHKQKEKHEDARLEQQINDLNMNEVGAASDSKGRGAFADNKGRVVQSGNVKTITNSNVLRVSVINEVIINRHRPC